MIKINECVTGPQSLAQLFAAHNFARMLHQDEQNLKRLLLKANLGAIPTQLTSLCVQLENAEVNKPIWIFYNGHVSPSPQ